MSVHLFIAIACFSFELGYCMLGSTASNMSRGLAWPKAHAWLMMKIFGSVWTGTLAVSDEVGVQVSPKTHASLERCKESDSDSLSMFVGWGCSTLHSVLDVS